MKDEDAKLIAIIVVDIFLRTLISCGFIFVLIKRMKDLSNCATPEFKKTTSSFYVRLFLILI